MPCTLLYTAYSLVQITCLPSCVFTESVDECDNMFTSLPIDHTANLQNDAWWEGRGLHLMHCGKEKDEIFALDLPTMYHSED